MGQRQKFNIISLGCARNLVDSEVMAGVLHQNDYELVPEPETADIVLINTCGFIAAAKEESIDTILDVARLKEEGKVKKLIVAGCLSQRYPNELAKELPEVDFFIGTGEVPRIAEILKEHEAQARRQYVGLPSYLYDHSTPRIRSTPSYTAFVKVSEGCDHKCAFCIIPQMRGPHRSRSIDSISRVVSQRLFVGVELGVRINRRQVPSANSFPCGLHDQGIDRRVGRCLHEGVNLRSSQRVARGVVIQVDLQTMHLDG